MTNNLTPEQLEILKQHLISDSSFVEDEEWRALIDSYESQSKRNAELEDEDSDKYLDVCNENYHLKLELDVRQERIAELEKDAMVAKSCLESADERIVILVGQKAELEKVNEDLNKSLHIALKEKHSRLALAEKVIGMFANHRGWCDCVAYSDGREGMCSCGLETAIAKLKEEK